MLNVGLAGIGFMGVTHFNAMKSVKGARVTAICTRDEKKLAGDWSGVQGNFGGAGGTTDTSKLRKYRDFNAMLADDGIDMVDICLPTPLHREAAITALRAGKHVLVEKPIALTLKDADAMISAAEKAGRMLLVAHVLRFFPAFAEAHAIVHSGKYGELQGVHLKRIIGRKTAADAERYFTEAGGVALDLHIHDTDFMLHLAGVPSQVRATGIACGEEFLFFNSHYQYAGRNLCASAQSGAVGEPPVTFEHGFDIYLERATLRYNNLSTGDVIQLCAGGKQRDITPRRKDAFVAQLQHATDCIREIKPSSLISAQNARRALEVCLLERQSAKTGKAMRVPEPRN